MILCFCMSDLILSKADQGILSRVIGAVREFSKSFIDKNQLEKPNSEQIKESNRLAAQGIARRIALETDYLQPLMPESQLGFEEIQSLNDQKAPESFFTEFD